mmetsp:Transcript_17157/g.16376  ORF Transcript_17157/g.16376 Transcript_17157/m.16376 type:complete len:98 (+) Transcript_17157:206-499(+)
MMKAIHLVPQEETLRVSFFDTSGEEKYHAITACHYRKATGALIVYDVTSRLSFENLQKWLGDVKQLADPDCAIVILGNKCDVDKTDIYSTSNSSSSA